MFLPFIGGVIRDTNPEAASDMGNYLNGILGEVGLSLPTSASVEPFVLPLLGLGIFFVFITEVRRFRIKYVIYEDRVVKIVGIISHHIKDVCYDHVDSLRTKRPPTERIMGTADLVLQTPNHKDAMIIEGVSNPEWLAEYIMKRAGIWD